MNFNEVLGDALAKTVQEAIDKFNEKEADKSKHVKFVDLSSGDFVSRQKFNDKVTELTNQVNNLTEKITTRDNDLKDLQGKLEAAQTDAGKLADIQKEIQDLRDTYAAKKKEWEEQRAAQAYEFAIKTKAEGLKFSSQAAKKDFIRSAIEKEMKMDGDTVLGFDDYLKSYQAADPGAFAKEDDGGGNQPRITDPGGSNRPGGSGGMSLAEAMEKANAGEKVEAPRFKT